jgi:hypothetical protein
MESDFAQKACLLVVSLPVVNDRNLSALSTGFGTA